MRDKKKTIWERCKDNDNSRTEKTVGTNATNDTIVWLKLIKFLVLSSQWMV